MDREFPDRVTETRSAADKKLDQRVVFAAKAAAKSEEGDCSDSCVRDFGQRISELAAGHTHEWEIPHRN